MKTKLFFTATLLTLSLSSYAQIELVYTDNLGRVVIDRNKKLFWMDGDDDPCYEITNYKKSGTNETFKLLPKEEAEGTFNVVLNVTAQRKGTLKMVGNKITYNAKIESTIKDGEPCEGMTQQVFEWFRGKAGYPKKVSVNSGVPTSKDGINASKENLKDGGVKGAAKSVGDAAKGAFGKVKGLFKKKDK